MISSRVLVLLAFALHPSIAHISGSVTSELLIRHEIKDRFTLITGQSEVTQAAVSNLATTPDTYTDIQSTKVPVSQLGVTTVYDDWNQTCHENAKFEISAESFLNYLLRLKFCGVVLGNDGLLQKACDTREYNFTEYYRVGYLRFCDRDMYSGVCRKHVSTKTLVLFEDSSKDETMDKSFSWTDQIALVQKAKAESFLQNEDAYMIDLACTGVENFSNAFAKSEFYSNKFVESESNTTGTEFAFAVNSQIPSANTSFPNVVFSEWYNPIIPFCRAFTCGTSQDEYEKATFSFYKCMPQRCQVLIVSSIVFDVILAVLTIIANSLVLGVAARTKIMRNVPGYFKISLAIADLIVGVFVLPTSIFITYKFYIGPLPFREPGQIPMTTDYISRPLANFIGFFVVLSFALSIYTMGMASIDRYLAITKPFKYRQGQYLTKRRCAFAFAAMWLAGFFVALYPVFTAEPYALTAFNLLLSTGISSSIVYAVGLCIPLVAVWSLNGAMLSQVCADGEKRRSIRATGVLAATEPQNSIRSRSATPSISTPAHNEEEDAEDGDKSIKQQPMITHVPLQKSESETSAEAQPYNQQYTKQAVSRNISSSSVSYYNKNEKRTSFPAGEGIIERMKRKRSNRSLQSLPGNTVARRPSIVNTAANVERRLARTLAIMIGAFTFALLPNIVVLIINVCLSSDTSATTYNRLATAFFITSRILLSNSFWNCIIYSIRNRHFRRAMWAIFLLKKERIDRKLRTSITMSNWKRRSRMQSSSGSSVHDKQSLSKTSSTASSGSVAYLTKDRRSTMMWSLASTSPCPSRKGSTDILQNKQSPITRSISNNVDINANKSKEKSQVTRSESAPPSQECKKFTIPTLNVELIEEAKDDEEIS